jgi:CRP/FNR family cyclic AMP-dependent transcriptional regulator
MATAYDLLAGHPFLSGLTKRQLERLANWSQRSFFHAGNRVFHEGDRADRFWLIQEGRVQLDTYLRDRDELVAVDTLGPGAVLGWSWLFPPYRWHFGAVAVETSLTVEVDGPGIRELCVQEPQLGYDLAGRFLQVVVRRLQATRTRVIDVHPDHSLTA